jgi:radical SAM superfamily enzyme YgiQ (UPF0313 family)
MARVLFVFSIDGHRRFDRRPLSAAAVQLGISYISALLKAHGHETRLVVLESRRGAAEFPLVTERLRAFEPTLVCHTAVATQYPFIVRVAEHVRALRPNLPQLIGGVHVSLNPEQALRDGFDAVCVGEGEHPTLELAAALDAGLVPTGIANLWLRRGGDVQRNATRPCVRPLDSLPPPDRRMWDEWLDHSRPPVHTVLLGRGCPYQCAYCCNHALKKLAAGPYVRMRTPEAVVREIESLAAPSDAAQNMYLEVETFMLDSDWTESFCDRLAAFNARRRRPIRFGANVRVDAHIEVERFFAAFAQANIQSVNIVPGVRSERIRRDVLRRYYSNDDVLRTVRAARTHGMQVALYNLIGTAGETWRDFLETARMNRLCRPDAHRTSIFYPYPGTALHGVCREQGLLGAGLPTDRERKQAALDLPGFPRRRIQECHDYFDVYVAHANPMWCRLHVLWRRCTEWVDRHTRGLPGYWRVRCGIAAGQRLVRGGVRATVDAVASHVRTPRELGG